jgi:hypothetical protein
MPMDSKAARRGGELWLAGPFRYGVIPRHPYRWSATYTALIDAVAHR